MWISCGDSVQFGNQDFPSDLRHGQLTEVFHNLSGATCMMIELYERHDSAVQTPLDLTTRRLRLEVGVGAKILLDPEASDDWIGPYSVQPDFDDPLCVYHCPWMHILA